MGYTDLQDWTGPDMAFDLVGFVTDDIIKRLKSALKEKGNEFNPSGAINVALFTEAFILPIAKPLARADGGYAKLEAVLSDAYTKLGAEYEAGKKLSADDWSCVENKRAHMKAYKRMLKNLDKTLLIFEKS
jgi:hypothetical protein